MRGASQVALLWVLVLTASGALAFPMPALPDAGTPGAPASAESDRPEEHPDGGVPSIAEEATQSEEPEPPTTEEKPEKIPGALIDPDLTGIVVRTWQRTGWRASAQVHYGSGIGSYIGDLAGQGLDAVLVAPGRLETVSSFGFYVGLEPQWTEWLASTFVYGYLDVSPPASLPGTTLERTHYLSGNLKARPVRSFELGAELLFGRRRNQDGAADDALRLILSTRFFY